MNRLLRKVLLLCARNPWLGERLPNLPFMKRAVHRFMPGEDIENALSAAVDLQVLGIGTLYTKLGEATTDAAGAQAAADHYLELLKKIEAAEVDGELSVKPTQLGLDIDEDVCFGHLRVLAAAAGAQGPGSGSTWRTAPTSIGRWTCTSGCGHPTGTRASASRRTSGARRRMSNGCCRSALPSDWSRAPTTSRSPSRSSSKKEVDANFLGIAVTMIRESRTRSMRVGLGTHDVELIEQIATHAAAAGVPKDGYEVQMLYGIRAKEQRRLARSGYTVQILVAYGPAWYRWYMRRLAERPANVLFALRQLLPG